jgi:hypothetical protein
MHQLSVVFANFLEYASSVRSNYRPNFQNVMCDDSDVAICLQFVNSSFRRLREPAYLDDQLSVSTA